MIKKITLLCLILIFCNPSHAQAQEGVTANIIPTGDFTTLRKTDVGRVSDIINPMTIKLESGQFIHLVGLDFPDMDLYEPGDLSVTAMAILNDFLKGQNVIIYQTQDKERGRTNRMGYKLAHLVRADDGSWTQGLLLALGLTRVRTTQYNPEMAHQMLALENSAREQKNGLWGMEQYTILSPQQTEKQIGSFQIIEGTVISTARRKNRLYLNFGHNWRNDFTISVPAKNIRQFTKKKIDPQKLNGQRIRVRGMLQSYNGPYIEINHPERFELIGQKPSAIIDNTQKKPQPKTQAGSALPKFND